MKIKNNSGFSLVEILIAAALMGGLSLVFMQMNKTQVKANADSSANVDVLDLKRNIIATLMDKNSCKATFTSGAGVNFNIGQSISIIKNSGGTNAFVVGDNYGEGKVKIISLITQDQNIVGSDGLRSVNLNVGISKTVMGKVTNKSFPVTLRVKATGPTAPIVDCFSDTSGLVLTAKEEACASIGGVWDAVAVTCQLPSCPGGQVLQALNPNGTAVCRSPSCVSPQMFQGLDAAGNAICLTPNPVYQ